MTIGQEVARNGNVVLVYLPLPLPLQPQSLLPLLSLLHQLQVILVLRGATVLGRRKRDEWSIKVVGGSGGGGGGGGARNIVKRTHIPNGDNLGCVNLVLTSLTFSFLMIGVTSLACLPPVPSPTRRCSWVFLCSRRSAPCRVTFG